MAQHLPKRLRSAWERKEVQENWDILERIDSLLSRGEDLFNRNYESGRDHLALKSLAEIRSTLELLSRISFSLHQLKTEERKAQDDEDRNSASEEFSRKLSVLSTPELKMLERLHDKVYYQNKEKVIIPESKKFGEAVDFEEIDREPLTRTRNNRGMVRNK
jgi:hypothetical protein